jgi:3-keto-L-gulonate-6-phosphate decarboxylase
MPDLPLLQLSLDLASLAVAGGITVGQIPFFSRLPVSFLITDGAIYRAAYPLAAARETRSEITRLWAGA